MIHQFLFLVKKYTTNINNVIGQSAIAARNAGRIKKKNKTKFPESNIFICLGIFFCSLNVFEIEILLEELKGSIVNGKFW